MDLENFLDERVREKSRKGGHIPARVGVGNKLVHIDGSIRNSIGHRRPEIWKSGNPWVIPNMEESRVSNTITAATLKVVQVGHNALPYPGGTLSTALIV